MSADYELFLLSLRPYGHSALWLLVMGLLVWVSVRLLLNAWRQRDAGEGLCYVYAVYALIPLVGAGLISILQHVDVRRGLVGLCVPLLYVLALIVSIRAPHRHRARRY